MKTKPAKLLLALLLGLGGTAFVASAALAEDSEEDKDARDSHVSAGTASCTGRLISACGLKVVKTSCTGSTVPSTIKSEEEDDTAHESKAKDSSGKNDRDYYEENHRDHVDHSRDSLGGKVSICHRMGGAEHALTVANDGWLSGHSKHDLDTIGRCADFDIAKNEDDNKQDNDKDHRFSASESGYGMGLTTTQIACLKGDPASTFTIGGKTYPGAGLNSGSFSINIQSPQQGPSRGGSRTLH